MEQDCRRVAERVGPFERLLGVGSREQVAAGGHRSFFVCGGEVLGCGDNSRGQLGLPRRLFGESVRRPTGLPGLREKVASAH